MKRLLFLLLLIPGLLEAQTVTITGDGAATTVELTGPVGPTGPIGPTGPTGSALTQSTYALLGTPADGIINYCTDCSAITPCAAGGTGAFATRSGGIWSCAKAPANLAYADLGTPSDGSSAYCTDCQATDPCTSGGTGAFAYRIAGSWSCASTGGAAGVADPGSNGIMARTALDTSAARTIVAGEGIVVANGTGVAGNPTISMDGTTVVAKGSGTALPAACGDTGDDYLLGDRFLHTVEKAEYVCTAIDIWSSSSRRNFVTSLEFFDDFLVGLATTGNIGFGWNSIAIGSGSSNAISWTGTAPQNPGCVILDTGVTDNTGYAIFPGNNGTSLNVAALFFTHPWHFEAVVLVGATSDATETGFWFGLSNGPAAGGAATRGTFLRYDTDLGDSTFVAAICDSATTGCQEAGDATNQESASSGVNVTDDTWYRLRIRHDPTGSAGGSRLIAMQVNDAAEVTFCSSGCTDTVAQFANDTMAPSIGLIARGTTEKHWWVDYAYLKIDGLDRY